MVQAGGGRPAEVLAGRRNRTKEGGRLEDRRSRGIRTSYYQRKTAERRGNEKLSASCPKSYFERIKWSGNQK